MVVSLRAIRDFQSLVACLVFQQSQPEISGHPRSPNQRRVAYSTWAKSLHGLSDDNADACGAGAIGMMLRLSTVEPSSIDMTCCSRKLQQYENKGEIHDM